MRVLPRFVMLLACVPLLLPPGLCVCGASEAAPKPANTGTPLKESHAPKRCGCSHHVKSNVTPTRVAAPAPHEPEHPAHHAPGCPATPGAERSKFTERAQPVEHLTAVAFVTMLVNLPALADAVRVERAVAHTTPLHEEPPRYRKHCALLF